MMCNQQTTGIPVTKVLPQKMPMDDTRFDSNFNELLPGSEISVELKTVDQLTDADWQKWEDLRTQGCWMESPFLAPEFVKLATDAFPSTRVAVLKSGSTTVGFWPFESRNRTGNALAALVTELSGVVASDQLLFNPSQLLPLLGLKRWKFDCVPESQQRFHSYFVHRQESFYLSLAGGFEEYQQQLKSAGSRQWADNARKVRKLEREHQSLQWTWHESDPGILDQLFAWKREQYKRTGQIDVLGIPQVQSLVRQIHKYQSKKFSGVLSCLSIDRHPIALHLGILNQNVLTSWFPTYDPAFAAYSPGRILLLKIIEESARRGIQRIDFGQGDERYKKGLCTGSFIAGEGVVCSNQWDRLVSSAWIGARNFAQNNAFCQAPLKLFRTIRNTQKGVLR